MTPRERVITALNREKPDKVPKELSYGFGGFTPGAYEKFISNTDSTKPEEYFNYEVRPVSYPIPERRSDQFYRSIETNIFDEEVEFNSKYEEKYQKEMAIINGEWGIGVKKGGQGSEHFVETVSPMKDYQEPEEIENHSFPNLATPENFRYLKSRVMKIQEKGLAAMGELYTTILEKAEDLRGMEQLFRDLYKNRTFANKLFEKMAQLRCKQANQFARAGVDILRLGDDIGDQKSMLISPNVWREMIKPKLRGVIKSAKEVKGDILVFYHSDGNCKEVIPDLIEVGVDVLNPVQPEVLDPARIKKEFGDQLAFWGTIGIQKTLPFGTPKDVKQEVKNRIETVGKDGGLLLAPSHVVEPEVPWENITAFFEAIDEYGSYE